MSRFPLSQDYHDLVEGVTTSVKISTSSVKTTTIWLGMSLRVSRFPLPQSRLPLSGWGCHYECQDFHFLSQDYHYLVGGVTTSVQISTSSVKTITIWLGMSLRVSRFPLLESRLPPPWSVETTSPLPTSGLSMGERRMGAQPVAFNFSSLKS